LNNLGDWTLEIVKRSDAAKGFILLPRRWVVERTFAWLNRNRRLAKDVEATIESAVSWLFIASVKLMSRRLLVARTRRSIGIPSNKLIVSSTDSSQTLS
jgi:transposase